MIVMVEFLIFWFMFEDVVFVIIDIGFFLR